MNNCVIDNDNLVTDHGHVNDDGSHSFMMITIMQEVLKQQLNYKAVNACTETQTMKSDISTELVVSFEDLVL